MNYKLSIVVPVFNKVNFTKSCLKDLVKLPNNHEIIIVNNGSTDYTSSIMASFGADHENFVGINLRENLGFGRACGIGYKVSSAPNVLFLNNDIRVKGKKGSWTQPLIDTINDKENILAGPTFGQLDSKLNFVRESNKCLGGNSYLSGWCLSGSKKTFNRLILPNDVGPFSSEFFCYFEDTDLSFRSKQLKIQLKHISVPVVHFGKQSSSQLNTTKLFSDSQKVFLKKWKKLIKK